MVKIKDKENIRGSKGKATSHIPKGIPIRLLADFSAETLLQARESGTIYLK